MGQTVTWSAVPFSWPPFQDLVYQWYFENAPIAAATNETFTLRNANPTNAGNYWVVASNPVGAVTSRLARLQIVSSVRSAATHVPIYVPDYGQGSPYPSAITLQGAIGTLSKLVVTLYGMNHTAPSDFDILLAGPLGQTVVLMSDAGRLFGAASVNLTFDDDAPSTLPSPDGPGRIVSGTYRPTNYAAEPDEIFPPPAPLPPYGDSLSVFNNTDPNGT